MLIIPTHTTTVSNYVAGTWKTRESMPIHLHVVTAGS